MLARNRDGGYRVFQKLRVAAAEKICTWVRRFSKSRPQAPQRFGPKEIIGNGSGRVRWFRRIFFRVVRTRRGIASGVVHHSTASGRDGIGSTLDPYSGGLSFGLAE